MLAVLLELLLLFGLVSMVNSSSKNVVMSPEVLSIQMTAVAPPTKAAVQVASSGKGEGGTKLSLSSADLKMLAELKGYKPPQKPEGSPKGTKASGPYEAQTTTLSTPATYIYKPADVNPMIQKTYTPQIASVNASTTLTYTFSQLVNLGIPNFQAIEAPMKRDYELELSKLTTERAYTLGGTVKGIVKVQTDGSVKVVKVISSPSVLLTDIYTRNLEKFLTFPRSFALQGIQIDATFNPSSGTIK